MRGVLGSHVAFGAEARLSAPGVLGMPQPALDVSGEAMAEADQAWLSPTGSVQDGRMSPWTHAFCVPCWNRENPDRAVTAAAYSSGPLTKCCRCLLPTQSGIYVRKNPVILLCVGASVEGGEHQDPPP